MEFLPRDWARIFALETPLLELVARGSILHFGILLLLRLMLRRTGGELATMDLLFVVLIAEAAAHALGEYSAVTDGLVLVVIIMGWNYVINTLSYHSPVIARLVASPPLQIIRDGQLLRRNMRREFLTEEELLSQLRQEGIAELTDVKAAYVEGEGRITVISTTDAGG